MTSTSCPFTNHSGPIRTYSDYSTTTATEWTSVLKIACENRFCEMQHCAIRGLEGCHLTTVHRIKLYELYKVAPKFLAPLYVEMAMRDAAPSEEDTTDLGDKTVLRIFRLREALRSRRTTNISPLPAGVDEHEATRVVCAFFDIDPAAISLPGAHVTFPSGTPCPISLTSQLKPQARTRTHTLTTLKMGASSINQGSREAFIYGDNFFLGLEGHGMPTPAGNVTKALDIESSTLTTSNLASEAVDIAHKTIPRQFEAEKEVVGSFTSESGSHHMSDDSSNVFVNFLVVFDTIQNTAIPLVPQLARARADLVFFSTFWTLVLFWAVSNMSS